jgi:hypothetical protein
VTVLYILHNRNQDCEDINMHLKETGFEGVAWIHVDYNGGQKWDLVRTGKSFWVS